MHSSSGRVQDVNESREHGCPIEEISRRYNRQPSYNELIALATLLPSQNSESYNKGQIGPYIHQRLQHYQQTGDVSVLEEAGRLLMLQTEGSPVKPDIFGHDQVTANSLPTKSKSDFFMERLKSLANPSRSKDESGPSSTQIQNSPGLSESLKGISGQGMQSRPHGSSKPSSPTKSKPSSPIKSHFDTLRFSSSSKNKDAMTQATNRERGCIIAWLKAHPEITPFCKECQVSHSASRDLKPVPAAATSLNANDGSTEKDVGKEDIGKKCDGNNNSLPPTSIEPELLVGIRDPFYTSGETGPDLTQVPQAAMGFDANDSSDNRDAKRKNTHDMKYPPHGLPENNLLAKIYELSFLERSDSEEEGNDEDRKSVPPASIELEESGEDKNPVPPASIAPETLARIYEVIFPTEKGV